MLGLRGLCEATATPLNKLTTCKLIAQLDFGNVSHVDPAMIENGENGNRNNQRESVHIVDKISGSRVVIPEPGINMGQADEEAAA